MTLKINAEILSAAINGKSLTTNNTASAPQKSWSLLYLAPLKEGIELVLETRSPASLALRLVDESYGLPAFDTAKFTGRPAHMMPAPFFRSDVSLVSQNYLF
jgi:hypothetical protein